MQKQTSTLPSQNIPQDGLLDRRDGNETTSNQEGGAEITPKQLDQQIEIVQERKQAFDTTELGVRVKKREMLFLNTKEHQLTDEAAHVQSAPTGETEAQEKERIRDKCMIVIQNLLRDILSTKEDLPMILTDLTHALAFTNISEQREALEKALQSIAQLEQDVLQIALGYFSNGRGLIQMLKRAYTEEFEKLMQPFVDEYLKLFEHENRDKTAHYSPNNFDTILQSDIHAITSGHLLPEGVLTLEQLREKVERLLELTEQKEREQVSDPQATVLTRSQQKRDDEAAEITDELAKNAQAAAASLPENSRLDQSDHAQTA